MKIVFTILGFCILFNSESQKIGERIYSYDIYYVQEHARQINTSGDVSEVKITSSRKNSRSYIMKFNEVGLLIEYYKGKKGDSIAKKAVIMYSENNIVERVNFYNKHKLDYYSVYKANDSGKIVEIKINDEKGELNRKRTWKYNVDGFIEEETFSKKKSEEIQSQWIYEFYDKGKMAHAYWYKKGKLKREWDYMCKPEGEEVTKKNLFKICQWYESEKDTLTAVYQSINDKGKTRKTIYKYTPKDTLILAIYYFNNDGKLIYKYTYDKSYEKKLTYTWFKRGKAKIHCKYEYKDDKLIKQSWFNHGEDRSSEVRTYDENGRLIETKYTGNKKKFNSTSTFEYTLR